MIARIGRFPHSFGLSIILPLLVLILATESHGEASAKQPSTDCFGDPLPPGVIARLGTIRLRTGRNVSHLVFSSDGKQLVSWSSDLFLPGCVSIWDAVTGRELRRVPLPGVRAETMVRLADGRGLALLSLHDGNYFIWNFTDAKSPLPPTAPPAKPLQLDLGPLDLKLDSDSCFAFAPNGKHLAFARGSLEDGARTIYLRELTVGRRIEDLGAKARQLGKQPSSCSSLHFTLDSRFLFAFSDRDKERETLVIWEVASGKQIRRMTVPRGRKAVAPDGKTLVLGLPDGTIHLWDAAAGRELRRFAVPTSKPASRQAGIQTLVFRADGKQAISGGRDGVLRLWDTASGREIRTIRGHLGWVTSLAISPDGKRIASAGEDGQIRIWDSATGADACPLDSPSFHLWRVALSPNGKRALTSSADGTVRLWNVATGRQTRRIDVGGYSGLDFSFTGDGKAIVGSNDLRIRLYNATTAAALPLPATLKDHPCRLCFISPDGKKLLTVFRDEVSIWEWPAGRLRHRVKLQVNEDKPSETTCDGLTLSPDGRRFFTLCSHTRGGLPSFDEKACAAVDLWDIAGGKRLRRLGSSFLEFQDAAFTPDGAGLLLAGTLSPPPGVKTDAKRRDEVFNLLDVRTGRTRRAFSASYQGEPDMLRVARAVACSPDGRTAASGEKDGSILLFEIATGLPRRRLLGHRGDVISLLFAPDGKRLITASTDTTGLVWDVSLAALGDPIAEAPAQLWDDLASFKADRAKRTLAMLSAAPNVAIPLLKEHLHPANAPDTATLKRLLADLESDQFAVRQKAAAELDRLGESIVLALRKRLGKSASPEARRCIEQLLDKHDRGELSPERVRELRALEVLEQVGTPEARCVLAGLAKGAAEARLTQEAKACLARMDGAPRSAP